MVQYLGADRDRLYFEEDCLHEMVAKVSAHLAGLLKICDVVSVVYSGHSQFVWTEPIADIDEV